MHKNLSLVYEHTKLAKTNSPPIWLFLYSFPVNPFTYYFFLHHRSGRLLLQSSKNILLPSALVESEEALNKGSSTANEVFVSLRTKSILHLFAATGRFLGLKVVIVIYCMYIFFLYIFILNIVISSQLIFCNDSLLGNRVKHDFVILI